MTGQANPLPRIKTAFRRGKKSLLIANILKSTEKKPRQLLRVLTRLSGAARMSYHKVDKEDHEDHEESDVDLESSPSSSVLTSQRWSLSWKSFDTYNRILSCMLLLLCSALLTVEITLHLGARPVCSENSFSILHNYGTKTRYMSLSPTFDHYWMPELSDHNALITLAVHSDGSEEHGAISMFHQLHCLSSIRMALQRASIGEDIGTDWHDDLHWPHCLHHLREMILCFADDTIERGIVINGTRTNAIDGAGDMRLCRDPRVLYERRKVEGVKEFKSAEVSLDW